ncbi:MAG: dipeptidase [Limnochordia bacterium]
MICIFDAHCDTLMTAREQGRTIWQESQEGHGDFPRMQAGRVACQILALCSSREKDSSPLNQVLIGIADLHRALEEHPGAFLIREAEDWQRLRQGKLGVLLALEGCDALEGRPEPLEVLFALGVRCLSLTWNLRNELADGVGDETGGGGLTRMGRLVVNKAVHLGMVLDVSHLSTRGFWDAMEMNEGVWVATHSNCRALMDHPRNLTDDQIKAIAARDGVVGINFYPPFLTTAPQATIYDVIRHILHVVELVGPEHVGLGSDFDGIDACPLGLEDVTKMPQLVESLGEAGLSQREISLILWENWLRVFQRVV